jgi:hypothetical protein
MVSAPIQILVAAGRVGKNALAGGVAYREVRIEVGRTQ